VGRVSGKERNRVKTRRCTNGKELSALLNREERKEGKEVQLCAPKGYGRKNSNQYYPEMGWSIQTKKSCNRGVLGRKFRSNLRTRRRFQRLLGARNHLYEGKLFSTAHDAWQRGEDKGEECRSDWASERKACRCNATLEGPIRTRRLRGNGHEER